MTTDLININKVTSEVELTTVEIAELTGKEHRNVKRDTETMLTQLYETKDMLRFEHIYLDAYNREQPCYKLPKNEVLILISGYSIPLRAAIVRRLDELEKQIMPKSLPEALRLYANEIEMKELALKQRDEAIKTKAWISDKKTATAMATASVVVRENGKLKEQIGDSKTYKQVKAINWIGDIFELNKSAYCVIGKQLSKISKSLNYECKIIESSEYPKGIKAYHVDVIEHFKHKLISDLNMLRAYRKAA